MYSAVKGASSIAPHELKQRRRRANAAIRECASGLICSLDTPSNPLNSHCPLALQLLPIPILLLLLAVLETRAIVALQHAVFAAKVSRTKPAVTHNPLSGVLAVLEVAADLLGGAAAQGQGHVQGAFAEDAEIGERGGG